MEGSALADRRRWLAHEHRQSEPGRQACYLRCIVQVVLPYYCISSLLVWCTALVGSTTSSGARLQRRSMTLAVIAGVGGGGKGGLKPPRDLEIYTVDDEAVSRRLVAVAVDADHCRVHRTSNAHPTIWCCIQQLYAIAAKSRRLTLPAWYCSPLPDVHLAPAVADRGIPTSAGPPARHGHQQPRLRARQPVLARVSP
jgi:hypothetical protein